MKDTKQAWFKEGKYGLFIHWGLYAVLAGEYNGRKTDWIGEWIMNTLDIPVAEYEKLAQGFNPLEFDAEEYVRRAIGWGMKYMVFTAKHHDGFAMYNSQCSDYNIVKATPFGRDVVRELKDACDKYGLKFGLYYSQAQDWHDPDGYRARADNSGKNFRRYLDNKCIPQLKELLTRYGELALIWFDTPMGITPEESRELAALVKAHQPNCLVSGRIGNNVGEYTSTGDNYIPLLPFAGDWEVPATLNDTWGFKKDDHNWKSPDDIIRLLLKINSRGGNYLLNIGPDALGRIPRPSIDILDKVGAFVGHSGEALYATTAAPAYPYDLEWCVFTHKPHRLYVTVIRPEYPIVVMSLANKVTGVRLLGSDEPVSYECTQTTGGQDYVRIRLPRQYHQAVHYTVVIETAEAELRFQPIPE